MPLEKHLVTLPIIESPSTKKRQGIDAIDAIDPITNQPASWVTEDQIRFLARIKLLHFQNLTDYIAQHFSEVIKQHSDEIMTRQNVQSLLDLVKNTNAAVIEEWSGYNIFETNLKCYKHSLRADILRSLYP